MDADTTAQLQSVQAQLQSEADSLQKTLTQIETLEGYFVTASMSPAEMLALRDACFSGLPNAEETRGQLDRLNGQLAAISKLLTANPG